MEIPTDIIAQRILKSGESKLVVSIAKPVRDEHDFRCGYLLLGDGGIEKTGYVIGMDAVQALQLVMKRIDSDLLAIGKSTGVHFSWLDDEPGISRFV
jgi:hypothetical protein